LRDILGEIRITSAGFRKTHDPRPEIGDERFLGRTIPRLHTRRNVTEKRVGRHSD
jgi:hypothetical protein